MKIAELRKIEKLYFSPQDIADSLNISYDSAKVTCFRYVKKGLLVRLKRSFYILSQRWENLSREEIFQLANVLNVPSYISLTSALAYYEITTQIQRNFIESVSAKKAKTREIEGVTFAFSKIRQRYYNSFVKKDNFFIAAPEKAFIDCLHLMAFNRYKLDIDAVDLDKLDISKINTILKPYPAKVKRLWSKICKN